MKEKPTGIVRFEYKPGMAEPMSAAQRKRLRGMKDENIDYSDAPASPPDAVWTRPGALIPDGNKKQITVRLDADVLEFFRKTGPRYQSRINAALREYMKVHKAC